MLPAVKCKSLAAAARDITINHKLFVCILLGKSLSHFSLAQKSAV